MKRKTYILASLILTAFFGGLTIWNFSVNRVSAQKSDNFGVVFGVSEYNARNEFALTQGGTSGVWRYGSTANDASNAFVAYSLTNTPTECGSPAERWYFSNSGDTLPEMIRFLSPATCVGTPTDSLYVHPGSGGQRSVLRFVAPAAGTYQLTGVLQRANPNATTDIRILKNETMSLFTGNINTTYQQSFSLTVTVAANDTIDFSVGFGNGSFNNDGTTLNVVVSQPPTACLTAPANLQVNVPAENSPVDVQSVNTNASLVGDAAYTNTGKVSRAFDFDGNGDYVRIEDNAAQRPATAFTIEAWAKFDSISGLPHIVSKPLHNPFNSYALYLEGGTLHGFLGNNSNQFTRVFSNFTPQLGVWHHLAFTYDFSGGVSTLKLYANGVEVTSGQDGTANLPLFCDANPYPLLIGGEFENNNPQFFLDGQADEVSIYGRALTQTEIFDIVQQGSFGKCPPANCVQPPNNLVSWFAGEQNALDSRSNNHGTNNGATFANGKVGQAFSFDGVDDYVAAPDSDSLDITGDLTLESWVRPAQTQAGEVTLVDKRDTPNNNINYVLFLRDGELRFASRVGGGAFSEGGSGVILTAGTFSHVAATIQNGSLQFYINGSATGAAQTVPTTRPATTGRLIIGATETSSLSGFFNGVIDEVSIYNRALTTAEILSIYNAGQSGKCKPSPLNPPTNQIAWFSGDGDTRDFTGLNSAGTLQGDTTFRVGRVAQGFGFDGSGDYITTADSPNWDFGTGNFAVEGWFKSPTPTGVQRIISAGSQADGVNNLWTLGYGDIGAWGGGQRINFAVFNGGGYNDYSSNPVQFFPNTWHHIAVVRSGSSFIFYLDGAPVGTVPVGAGFAVNGGSTGAIIGARYNNNSATIFEFANGMLDEVSVFNRDLSASEIAAVYNAGTAGKLKSVVTPVNFAALSEPRAVATGLSAKRINPDAAAGVSGFAPTTVQLSDASVTFAQVTVAGTTSENGVDSGLLPKLPTNVMFTGLAYDISTTAGYQSGTADDVQVCFNVPSLTGVSNLRILHLENNVWLNRTVAGGSAPNLCTDNLTSLSPFVIVQSLAPTAAAVSLSGRVSDAFGRGIQNVSVTLTDSQGRNISARTGSFGRYSFKDVRVGAIYIVSVSAKRYEFAVASQAVNLQEALEDVDFTASQAR